MKKEVRIPKSILLFGSKDLLKQARLKFKAKKIREWRHKSFPVYEFSSKGANYGLSCFYYGASAAAASIEDLISAGAERIIFVSYCRPIDEEIEVGNIILPTRAVRDEGTSFHYLKEAKHVYGNSDVQKKLKQEFKKQALKSRSGLTWSTDAPFSKVRRTAELVKSGALVIDNETAALFAVARYRKIFLGGSLIVDESTIHGRAKNKLKDQLKALKNHVISVSLSVLSQASFWRKLELEEQETVKEKAKPVKKTQKIVPEWDDRVIELAKAIDSEAGAASMENEENKKTLESVLTEAEFFIAQYNRTRSKYIRKRISKKNYGSISTACIEVLESNLKTIQDLKLAHEKTIDWDDVDHDEIAEHVYSQIGEEEENEPLLVATEPGKPRKTKLAVWLVNLPRRFRYKPYYRDFFKQPVDPTRINYRQFVGKVEKKEKKKEQH